MNRSPHVKNYLAKTLTGRASRQRLASQLSFPNSDSYSQDPEWMLARQLVEDAENNRTSDSKSKLESIGFKILGDAGPLYYRATPPQGWKKSTKSNVTTIIDVQGRERLSQVYQCEPHSERVFLRIPE